MRRSAASTSEMRCNLCVKCAEQDKIYISRWITKTVSRADSVCAIKKVRSEKCEMVALIKFSLICLFSLFSTSHIVKIFPIASRRALLFSLIFHDLLWRSSVFIGTRRFICSKGFFRFYDILMDRLIKFKRKHWRKLL